MKSRIQLSVFLASFALALGAVAQQPGPATSQTTQNPASPVANPYPQSTEVAGQQVDVNYTLGANDQILIRAAEMDEINERPFRIDAEGFLNLPTLGRIKAAGLTVHQLQAELENRLREYVVQPHVYIQVTQFRGAPVFFEGMFQRPGIYTLQGRRTLVEMLAVVGGLLPNASRRIRIRRHLEYGSIPLPGAIDDPERKTSTVEISFSSLRENVNVAEDIILQPYDVVTVDRAELIYVAGEVMKPGTIELGEREYVTVIQALSMSGGFTLNAYRANVRVLRPVLNTNRRAEIVVNLNGIYEGRANDFPLLPNDVLYVPRSNAKVVMATFMPIALGVINPFIYYGLSH